MQLGRNAHLTSFFWRLPGFARGCGKGRWNFLGWSGPVLDCAFAGLKVMRMAQHLAKTFPDRSAVSGSKTTSGGIGGGPSPLFAASLLLNWSLFEHILRAQAKYLVAANWHSGSITGCLDKCHFLPSLLRPFGLRNLCLIRDPPCTRLPSSTRLHLILLWQARFSSGRAIYHPS